MIQTTNFTEIGQKIIVDWQDNCFPSKIEIIQPKADDIVEMAKPTKIAYPRAVSVENKAFVGARHGY